MKVKDIEWKKEKTCNNNILYSYNFNNCRITVLNRQTEYSDFRRDIETGYMNENKDFWLASSVFDIRDYPDLNIDEAIDKIKKYANTLDRTDYSNFKLF